MAQNPIIDYNAVTEVIGQLRQVLVRGIDETGSVRSLNVDNGGAARFKDGLLSPLGYARYSSPAASTLLSAAPTAGIALPASARFALLQARTQDISWRDDDNAPTATEGMVLINGDPGFWYSGDLTTFRFIQVTGGGVLRVSYYA